MERRHKSDWACMVEPLQKFVQCFGVSKRPDQYIRLICGTFRLRVWRLNEPAAVDTLEVERLRNEVAEARETNGKMQARFAEEKQSLQH